MGELQDVEEVPYPPAPWNFKGQMWMGMFKSSIPRQLPGELKHLLDPHFFIVSVIRYLDGTLCYDELVFGTLARLGVLPGLYVDYMWVNNKTSLWGGRRIWGLPKNLADFVWDESSVCVSDSEGLVATVSLDMHPSRLPWVWMLPPEFGRLGHTWTYFSGSIWARLGNADMQVVEWSDRFSHLKSNKPSFSFGAKPFKMKFLPPKILGN